MATARPDQQRRRSSSGSGRKKARSSQSSNGRKPLQTRDTGYRVGSSRRQKPSRGINPKLIVAGVVGILLLITVIFGITSCVKGCSSNKAKKEEAQKEAKVNPEDARVAYGVSTEETAKLSKVLDRNEAFAKIAKSANKIKDERLIDLAIAEPEAIEFVAGSIKADGSSQPYGDAVPQGEYPRLYTYDTRWGYASFGDGIIGVTGSGPVALSMASMGLSGKTTYDPTTIANAVTAAKLAKGTTGMDDSFISNHASDAGLVATSIEVSSDGIWSAIAENQPVIIKLKSDSGIGMANSHWALITQLNSDNSINVYDPTSTAASTHSWSLGAVSSRAESAYALSAAAGTLGTSSTETTDTGETTQEGTGE